MGIKIGCFLYLCAIVFILATDIPHGAVSTANTVAISYVVLFNLALVVNIVRLVIVQRVFTVWSALYIGALAGFFMAFLTGQPTGIPLVVFGACLLYVGVYTVAMAVRGAWMGRI